MSNFPSRTSIIEKFIQSEIDKNNSSNEYILALNECTTLEDLIDEVRYWKNPSQIHTYRSVENYILMSLDND
jgi:5-methylcytosine-specific restriction endonuclease McrBC regulatory subunit McrC